MARRRRSRDLRVRELPQPLGEWGGVATTTPLDANNGTTGSSTTPATTVTTVADHDLVVGTAYIANTRDRHAAYGLVERGRRGVPVATGGAAAIPPILVMPRRLAS
jgi:hypothetical protein